MEYLKILNDGNLFNFETMNKIHVKNTKKLILNGVCSNFNFR